VRQRAGITEEDDAAWLTYGRPGSARWTRRHAVCGPPKRGAPMSAVAAVSVGWQVDQTDSLRVEFGGGLLVGTIAGHASTASASGDVGSRRIPLRRLRASGNVSRECAARCSSLRTARSRSAVDRPRSDRRDHTSAAARRLFVTMSDTVTSVYAQAVACRAVVDDADGSAERHGDAVAAPAVVPARHSASSPRRSIAVRRS